VLAKYISGFILHVEKQKRMMAKAITESVNTFPAVNYRKE
jgi:hypothetical protein